MRCCHDSDRSRCRSERQKQVLHGLSFSIEPRTKVAFVGKAGCGKSTSVTLIQRFYDVAKGKVLLDGRPISDYDVRHLRRHIGVVAQDNILFSASILENIVYGMGQGHLPEASMEDVKEACDMANVTEFLETFPNGVHTFVGEKGVKLSGGQKQRLAIARAIIRCVAAPMLWVSLALTPGCLHQETDDPVAGRGDEQFRLGK